MALSNWATLAWDENGKPCKGRIEVERVFEAEGIVVEIYKNWLYVRDEKSWREGSGYMKPIVMTISQGQLEYYRLKIIARRGSNDELFVVIEYNNKDSTEKKQLIGIACYGYDGDDYVGVTEDSKKEFFDWIKNSREDWWPSIDIDIEKIKDFKVFNQGDIYLAKELGINTPVNTDEPILSKALKCIKDRYPYGECPDCHKPIPDHITEGCECSSCGHVFYSS